MSMPRCGCCHCLLRRDKRVGAAEHRKARREKRIRCNDNTRDRRTTLSCSTLCFIPPHPRSCSSSLFQPSSLLFLLPGSLSFAISLSPLALSQESCTDFLEYRLAGIRNKEGLYAFWSVSWRLQNLHERVGRSHETSRVLVTFSGRLNYLEHLTSSSHQF